MASHYFVARSGHVKANSRQVSTRILNLTRLRADSRTLSKAESRAPILFGNNVRFLPSFNLKRNLRGPALSIAAAPAAVPHFQSHFGSGYSQVGRNYYTTNSRRIF